MLAVTTRADDEGVFDLFTHLSKARVQLQLHAAKLCDLKDSERAAREDTSCWVEVLHSREELVFAVVLYVYLHETKAVHL